MKIIFISLDTLKTDRLGCYGYPLPTNPYLDKISEEGVSFESAFSMDIPTEVAHTSFVGKVGLTTGVVFHMALHRLTYRWTNSGNQQFCKRMAFQQWLSTICTI